MKYFSLLFLLIFILVGFVNKIVAQEAQVKDTSYYNPSDDFSISAFPLVFFLPETGLAFGGAGITVFNIGKEKTWRKSSVQLGAAYTLKNQLLIFVPYELYFKENWKVNGELGYYKYFYNFYGIGVHSKISDLEFYDADFPRVIVNVNRRIQKKYFIGTQYRFDNFDVKNTSELLNSLNPEGIQGGVASTIGLTLAYDDRDDIFYPSQGFNIQFLNENSLTTIGSDFSYNLFSLDFSYFKEISKNHIIASNYYTGTTVGESPFFNYYYLSSGKKGRGFNDRRFIDKNINLLQVEYRFPIYKRFRGVAFSSLGTVGSTYSETWTNDRKFAYGLGFRYQLSKKQKSNIRLDLANSYEGFQFYLTIGEAF